jgi:uncharacterized protein YutE (UPF0331/DUF86 family)
MTALDTDVLAQKVSAVERHLARVARKLPATPAELRPSTDAADAVLLHLWQAVQIVIDLAVALCVRSNLGTPSDYGSAFRMLAEAGKLDPALAERLVRAAGFRNAVAHAYETIDMRRVHDAASRGPDDLRAFLRIARDVAALK